MEYKNLFSTNIKRQDAYSKISGKALYTGDLKFPDMVYCKIVRSSIAKGIIKDIEIPKLPNEYITIDYSDIPKKNAFTIVTDDMPVLAEKYVNYIGEPILLIVGPDKKILSQILNEIKITYEEDSPIFNPADSNIFAANYSYSKGSLDDIKEKAKYVIRNTYTTGYQEHAYMEPQSMVSYMDNDVLTIHGSMQCPYYVKNALIEVLGLDSKYIRVIQAPTGGGFGGKEEYPSLPAVHVALATYKYKKPVQLIFDRSEDMAFTTKRHPSSITITSYVNSSNEILGHEIDVLTDAGAYSGLSPVVLQRIIFSVFGVYETHNINIVGKSAITNKVPTGAFRGFGGPQAFFAIELQMDHIANELALDSLDFRMKHMIKKGSSTSTSGLFRYDIKLPEIIEKICSMSDYINKYNEYKTKNCKGIGISLFFHGCGFTGSGEKDILKPRVGLIKDENGKFEILVSSAEIGQGASTTLRKIAAAALNEDISNIIYNYPDTKFVPDSGPTVASRTILIVGRLIHDICLDMLPLKSKAEKIILEREFSYPKDLSWNQDTFEGDAYISYSFGANIVELEIDPITYTVSILNLYAVYDIGQIIDPLIVEGQVEGGFIQGLSYGLMENIESKNGVFLQKNFTDYIIPTSKDFPKIKMDFISSSEPAGPFYAKGLGELSFVGVPSSLAIAIRQALKKKITHQPMIPEYLMEVANSET